MMHDNSISMEALFQLLVGIQYHWTSTNILLLFLLERELVITPTRNENESRWSGNETTWLGSGATPSRARRRGYLQDVRKVRR